MQQLSALDNLMLEGELPNIPMHMSALMIYDTGGKRGGARLQEVLSARFENIMATHFPILRCKVERLPLHLDRAYWVEDAHFSVAHHLSHVALPKNQDWPALYRLFGEFHALPLDTTRPLWQVQYVEGLDKLEGIPRGATALFMKIHHSVFDGKGALALFNGLHNVSPEADSALLIDSMPVEQGADADFGPPSLLAKYGRAWWHSIERPIDLAGTVLKLLPGLWSQRTDADEAEHIEIPRSIFNQPVSADRVVGHIRMDLDILRKLESKIDCTVNDIALCVIAGALRGYLLDRDALPDTHLYTLMPINIRQPDEAVSLGNHVSVARVSLHTGISDVTKRLKSIHVHAKRGKKKGGSSNSRALLELVDEIHPAIVLWIGEWLINSGYIDELPQSVNTVVTNVPGNAEELYVGNARLVDYLGFGPLAPNVGLFHTVSSTADHINITFLSTSELLGDGQAYIDWLARSWEEVSGILQPAKKR